MRYLHLSFIIPKDYESIASRVPPHQLARVAPSLVSYAVLWMRYQTSECSLEKAVGGNMGEIRSQRGRTAAYESGVDLENPIGISTTARRDREKVTHIQSKFLPSYHVMSVT